jgi:methionine-S-sulfoxide reductase
MNNTESIILGGGCFWCLEAAFLAVPGVVEVVSGYTGGVTANPTYEDICKGNTGHAEVVQVTFDTSVISLEEILAIFWKLHDPTSLNKQGNDVGTQYRSSIFYTSNEQRDAIQIQIAFLEEHHIYSKPIVTQVEQLITFYPAEEYHQNYFEKNPHQGYCQFVIAPKLKILTEYLNQKKSQG